MNHPYRSSSTKIESKAALYKYRVRIRNEDLTLTIIHYNYYIMAWLYAWWYCFKNSWGDAEVQVNTRL